MSKSIDRPFEHAAKRIRAGQLLDGRDMAPFVEIYYPLEWTSDLLWAHFHFEYAANADEMLEKYLTEAAEYQFIGDFLSEPAEQLSLLSAFGILSIEKFVGLMSPEGIGWEAVRVWDDVVECVEYLKHEIRLKLNRHEIIAAHTREHAREIALARHNTGPIAEARAFMHDCWLRWQESPADYKSGAAFARAMVDKFPELVTERTVTSWVTLWRRSA